MHGCIRMSVPAVKALYPRVPAGALVMIEETSGRLDARAIARVTPAHGPVAPPRVIVVSGAAA